MQSPEPTGEQIHQALEQELAQLRTTGLQDPILTPDRLMIPTSEYERQLGRLRRTAQGPVYATRPHQIPDLMPRHRQAPIVWGPVSEDDGRRPLNFRYTPTAVAQGLKLEHGNFQIVPPLYGVPRWARRFLTRAPRRMRSAPPAPVPVTVKITQDLETVRFKPGLTAPPEVDAEGWTTKELLAGTPWAAPEPDPQ